MQQAAAMLLGEHDFSAFRAADCQARSPVRTIRKADVQQSGEMIVFDFEAGAYLHHMVRNLVGSLVYVGQGKHPAEWIGQLLHLRDRRLAAPTFSAAGLYLVAVKYEPQWELPVSKDSFLPGSSGY
jgi:tRNA pseudouridine38-40 synthase